MLYIHLYTYIQTILKVETLTPNSGVLEVLQIILGSVLKVEVTTLGRGLN